MSAVPHEPASRRRRRDPPPIEPEGSELVPGYRVLEHLNRGARLDVYDAWSIERDCRVVLKTLRPDRASEKRAAAALVREGRLLRRLTHPHLVRAYEVTRTADGLRPVVVLETLGGETLSHLLHRLDEDDSRLDPLEVAVLGEQLASVLSYIHRSGWLHLDVKPSNIIVVGGSARLLDLSIVHRPGRVRPGTGTTEYMAPEQARGDVVTAAADVWGLGAVMFAAVSGEPPYGWGEAISPATGISGRASGSADQSGTDSVSTDGTGTALGDVRYPQLMGDPPAIGARANVPDALGRLVDACLDRDPAARSSLSDVAADLRTWLASAEPAGPTR